MWKDAEREIHADRKIDRQKGDFEIGKTQRELLKYK